ncbi:MAG: ATP-binding protein [Candidatus Thorarchaeota archaeon]
MIRLKSETAKTILDRRHNLATLCWLVGTAVFGGYILTVYVVPLLGIISPIVIPNRLLVEILLCSLPILAGSALTHYRLKQEYVEFVVDDDVVLFRLFNNVIGQICLELTTVSGSIAFNEDGPIYNTAMLLALRSGVDKRTTFAYEVGVQSSEPFLRIFISVLSQNAKETRSILIREATRTEAILLSSLEKVDVKMLRGKELVRVINPFVDSESLVNTHNIMNSYDGRKLLLVRGIPKVSPTENTSQIGTFLSTALRQGYSLSLTCTFSTAKAGKEKKEMERKWKSIRSREKRNEDSLSDQAQKRTLIDKFEELNANSGWFDSSIYITINDSLEEKTDFEGIKGLILSIWGGDDTLSILEKGINRRFAYRVLMKRHIKSQRLHANKLAAYVNTPVQQLPVIAAAEIPVFQIPSIDYIENELRIGWAVYGGKRLNPVGLEVDWLREHVAILGATGTGKTTLVKKLMTEVTTKTTVPWWIFDVKGSEYSDLVKLGGVTLLRPGLDPSFAISILDFEMGGKQQGYSTFSLLRELLRENNSSDLSPAMEKLLRESVLAITKNPSRSNLLEKLVRKVEELAGNDRTGQMTRDALLNRLEILTREPLGSILGGGIESFKISNLMDKRVIFDLRYVSQTGGMDAARLLYNFVAKRIFDAAMRRGITPDLHHIVVLEEASNLVPEIYTRHSAADVTTGESMVMLQRATGQGVVVVSTRPNISSNILANTSTKITFRLPYDSTVGGRFMSIDSSQEQYLRILPRGRALLLTPHTGTFEIETELFRIGDYFGSDEVHLEEKLDSESEELQKMEIESRLPSEQKDSKKSVFDRIGVVANHVVAFLASRDITSEEDIHEFLSTLDSKITREDVTEILHDLVSLSTIQREAIPLVSGGFIYAPAGRGLSAVKKSIVHYLVDRLNDKCDYSVQVDGEPDIFVEDNAVLIIPEHLRASSFTPIVERIRSQMNVLRNGVTQLIVIVRGSVAAAKLRETLDVSEEFNEVTVVSAFPSSLDKLIIDLIGANRKTVAQTTLNLSDSDPDSGKVDLIEAVHDIGPATSRAVQMRLWFGLIQDFVDVSKGLVVWETLLEFIETTSMQSKKGRSAPLNSEEGRRALTELLADEVLVAVRMGPNNGLVKLGEGLWIANATVLKDLKEQAVDELSKELRKHYGAFSKNHGYYDLCARERSFVVFPTQQELNTLLNLHSDIACRTCNSTDVICILTAAEYLDDSIITPSNLTMHTMDDGLASIFI